MEWRTELVKVILPACDRSLAFHPWSLVDTLVIRSWKSTILFPRNLKFKPRYILSWVGNKFDTKEVGKAGFVLLSHICLECNRAQTFLDYYFDQKYYSTKQVCFGLFWERFCHFEKQEEVISK